ncbi:hypothetical protein Trydic_g167 [Trypoxylus dichotomus]
MSKSGKPSSDNKTTNNSTADHPESSQQISGKTAAKSSKFSISNRHKNKSSKGMQSTHSDGNLIKTNDSGIGLKQKLVNKVKHWNNRDGKAAGSSEYITNQDVSGLVSDLESLVLSPNTSEDNLFKSDWLRARDSLENLLSTRCNKCEISNSKSTHFPSAGKSTSALNESPCSESQIGNSKAMNSVSKVLAWDPWDKLSRKNKKKNKRQKYEKSPTDPNLPVHTSKDHTSGDELRNNENPTNMTENANTADTENYTQNYEYQPYQPKNMKAVEFTNEVMVVYITGDEVVGESTEPLKKELEQQIRNKEMRRGHCLTTVFNKKKLDEDYISAWLKK